jgi:hypothetical protein
VGGLRNARSAGLVLAVLAAILGPASGVARADRCGGPATVDPVAGPVGSEFVFTTDLGAPSTLKLIHDGNLDRTIDLDGDGVVTYKFVSQEGDEGSWVATAEVRTATFCTSEAKFEVLRPVSDPSASSTFPVPMPVMPAVAVAVVAVALALLMARWWRRREVK